MDTKTWRAAIVGSSTLLGKELAEQLSEAVAPTWDLALFDEERRWR